MSAQKYMTLNNPEQLGTAIRLKRQEKNQMQRRTRQAFTGQAHAGSAPEKRQF
jgi:hypothetical protein